MFFRPDQSPRPVFSCEFSTDFIGPIVTDDSISKIIGVADVELTFWILENVDPNILSLAPAVGFEPTTNRLTADRSTTELRWNLSRLSGLYVAQSPLASKCQSANPDCVGTLPLSYAGVCRD
jgi:hypothetical protein